MVKKLLKETALRQAILTKADIKLPTLSNRVRAIKDKDGSITSRLALGIVALREKIHLEEYFEASELMEIRGLAIPDVEKVQRVKKTPSLPRKTGSRQIEIKLPGGQLFHDPMLDASILGDAQKMAGIYPLLYLLENSIRRLIISVLEQSYGVDWWNSGLSNSGNVKKIKASVADRMAGENQKKWHQKRGAHEIYYTDFNSLGTIIFSKKEDFFPEPLGDQTFIQGLFNEIIPSRNVLGHMNPLENDSITDIRLKYSRWLKIVKEFKKKNP